MGKNLMKNNSFICKLAVGILCLIAVILWNVDRVNYAYAILAWMVIATATYLLIMIIFIVIYIVSETKPIFETLFLLAGCFIHIIGAIAELVYAIRWNGYYLSYLEAVIMIACGIIMAIDFAIGVAKKDI